MQTIPLSSSPNQAVKTIINNQNCLVNIRTQNSGLYFSLSVNGVSIVDNVLCLNGVKLIRVPYSGFVGELMFIDTEGEENPVYSGFGGRFQLVIL